MVPVPSPPPLSGPALALGGGMLLVGLALAALVLHLRVGALQAAPLPVDPSPPWPHFALEAESGALGADRLAHALPPELRAILLHQTGLSTDVLGVLLGPAAAREAALAGCPAVGQPLAALCVADTRAAAEARVDAALTELLTGDERLAAWVIESGEALGPRGVAVAAGLGAHPSALVRARALQLHARAAPWAAAVEASARHLGAGDPLRPVALLELGRLRAAPAGLEAVAAGRDADAALARWVVERAQHEHPVLPAPEHGGGAEGVQGVEGANRGP